jgi:hypothetical protein
MGITLLRNVPEGWKSLPETISPRPALRPDGDKLGDGSSPCSLSRADIRRLMGCRLPDAILHGKRSLRPRSRAVQRLAAAGFRVRLFSSLGLVVAPPACEPGQDTSAACVPRLDRLAPGQPLLLTVRSPGATGLASSLSGCLLFHRPAVSFLTSPTFRKVFMDPAETACPSRCARSLCPAFQRLSFG